MPADAMLSWRLAWRDLRGLSGGFRLLATALVLAVAAIAAVGSLADGLLGAARDGARQATGGDLSFRLFHRQPTADERSLLASFGDLSEIAELRVRVARPDGAAATLVELKAVDDAYPLHGSLVLDPPLATAVALGESGVWGAVVDAALLETLNLDLGDSLRLGAIVVEISARLVAEPDRALRAFALGPRVLVGRSALAASGLAAPGAAVYWYSRLRLADGSDPKAVIAAVETRFPHAGWRIVDAAEGIPGVERSIAFGRALILALALAILTIGGVGIAGAVTAHLDRKAATIAVLKTLGATGRLTTRMYMAQLALVAAVAAVVGLVLGGAGAALVAQPAGGWLGDGLVIGMVQPKALALAAAMGVLTTLLFAIGPLARAAASPPAVLFRALVAGTAACAFSGRQAIGRVRPAPVLATAAAALALTGLILLASDLPLVSMAVLGALLALAVLLILWTRLVVGAARRWRRRLGHAPIRRLALANLLRPAAPTTHTIVALGLALAALVAVIAIQASAARHLATALPAAAPDLVLINVPPPAGPALETLAGNLDGVAGLEIAPFLHGRVTHLDGVPVRDRPVPRGMAWVIRGDRGLSWPWPAATADPAWARGGAGEGRPTPASLAVDVAARLGLELGSRLTLDLGGVPHEVAVATFHEVDWTKLGLDFPILLVPPEEPPPHSLVAAIRLAPGGEPGSVEAALGRHFPDAPVIRVPAVLDAIGRLLGRVSTALGLATLLALLAAGLVLAGGLAAVYRQRRDECAILHCLGVQRRLLATAMALELGLIGVAAAVPAVILGSIAARLVVVAIAPDAWQFDLRLALGIVAGAAAALAALGYVLAPRHRHLGTLLR
jgi:putative ABC transport system permease protein